MLNWPQNIGLWPTKWTLFRVLLAVDALTITYVDGSIEKPEIIQTRTQSIRSGSMCGAGGTVNLFSWTFYS